VERYSFLDKFDCVVTGHHLDDALETWIWSSLHGTSKLLPHRRGNVIRPFLLNKKECFTDWAKRKGVPWVDDTSNSNTKYTRNYIRHELMPCALRVNPGLHKTIAKKIEDRHIASMKSLGCI
jgi:tRNA(Ile)-lysidine synthase